MSTATTSRNPALLAILLVAQGRTGSNAQLVFHYPPDPLAAARTAEAISLAEDDEEDSSSSDSEDSSSDDDFELFIKRINHTAPANPDSRSQNSDEDDEDVQVKRGSVDSEGWKPPWEPLLGLGEDGLVSLLTPGRAWHKRRFELGINDLTFLGRPVYAREEGYWRKPRVKKQRSLVEDDAQHSSDTAVSDSGIDDGNNSPDGSSEGHVRDKKAKSTSESTKTQLTMFHLVFVMDPSPLEHSLRVKDMYDHVVKKLSKVLKWEQSHHNYVWEQSELLQSIKSTHAHQQSSTRTLYTEMMRKSSLAAAIAKVFDNISASKIAAITLSSKLSVSLQIPPVTSTSYLPSLTEPPLEPGLWLTTATDPASTEADMDTASSSGALQLSKNFTLLLKASPQKILKDIQAAGGPLAMPLTNFISNAKPTKSFYKISVLSGINLSDIQHLARHLVYWRRAIAIPPLHQRDTYIVSPNANMQKLVGACKTYEATFPMMPSLPKMLSVLSGTPSPYGALIPSSDHKEEYYRVLEWLVREGWVTQLRTFALVRIDPEVKKAVREKEREEKGSRTPADKDLRESADVSKSFGSGTPTTVASSMISGFRQRPSMVSRPSSDGRQSISTDHTSSRGQQFKHNPKQASLVLSPQRASPEESRWLDHIASTLTSSLNASRTDLPASPSSENDLDTADVRRYWSVFVKYFSGHEALEKIPVREGLKRKNVWDMLMKMGLEFNGGVEDEKGENKKVLVTIRHW